MSILHKLCDLIILCSPIARDFSAFDTFTDDYEPFLSILIDELWLHEAMTEGSTVSWPGIIDMQRIQAEGAVIPICAFAKRLHLFPAMCTDEWFLARDERH